MLLFDGFRTLDAFGPYDVLANGAQRGPGYDVSLSTVEPSDTVRSAEGAAVVPDDTVDESDPDLLVAPGGGWSDRKERGAWAEAERGAVPGCLADRAAGGTVVAGVCTGGMLLARAGLLDGRPAVTHRAALDDLRDTAAEVVDARVVDAGDVLTAGGVTSGVDLALYLLEREFGPSVADDVAATLEYDRQGSVYVTE